MTATGTTAAELAAAVGCVQYALDGLWLGDRSEASIIDGLASAYRSLTGDAYRPPKRLQSTGDDDDEGDPLGFEVRMTPALPPDPVHATATGGEVWHPAEPDDRTAWFGVTLDRVRSAVNAANPGLGDLIDSISFGGGGYLVDPDLRVVSDDGRVSPAAISARVAAAPSVSVAKKPAIVNRVPLHNGTEEPQEFTVKVSLARSDTASAEWSGSTTIGASATVEVSVGEEGVAAAKASSTIHWEQTTTETHSETRQIDTGTDIEIHAHLAPGERAVAGVAAWRGTARVAVPVAARLTGWMTLHIRRHHWWILTAAEDMPGSGIKAGDQVHVTSCTVPLDNHTATEEGMRLGQGILTYWAARDADGRLLPFREEARDTVTVTGGEYIDADAGVVDVPSDDETAILAAAERYLDQRDAARGAKRCI